MPPKPAGRRNSVDLPRVMISSSSEDEEPPKKEKLTPGRGRKRNVEQSGNAQVDAPVGTQATRNSQNKENSAPAAKLSRKTLPAGFGSDLTTASDSSKQAMAIPQQVPPVSNATPKSTPPLTTTNLDQGKSDLKWYEMAIKNNEYFDVILLSSDNTEIKSHRFLLSKYSTAFTNAFKDCKTLPIKISMKDFGTETIQAVLDFMVDKFDSIIGKEFDVMKFASRYNIPSLIDHCRKLLGQHFTVTNICQFIQTVYSNNNEELKKKCLKFIVENRNQIDAAEFNKLPKNILIDVIRF